MRIVWAIVRKDFLQLRRDPAALFFTLGWPLIVAIVVGLIFGGGAGNAKPKVALVDLDRSATSLAFAASVRGIAQLDVAVLPTRDAAQAAVRRGQRAAAIVLPPGWGAGNALPFSPSATPVEVWSDPSRQAEQAMLQGLLTQAAMTGVVDRAGDGTAREALLAQGRADTAGLPADERARFERFFESLDGVMASPRRTEGAPGAGGGATDMSPLKIDAHSVEVARRGPRNPHAVSFPQGMFWAVLGCLMSFATALATERSEGTWLRLRAAPASAWTLLAGKGASCGLAMFVGLNVLALVGAIAFGLRPQWWWLEIAFACGAFAFTALMMLFATLATSVRAASGVAWAVLMPLSMLGGAMIPLFVMPPWMLAASDASPVKWMLLAIEGATWRGFDAAEMAGPCAILLATGAAVLAWVALRARRGLG